MKSFKEWRENREINEISSDLLHRAANAAASRSDSRGERLAGKFGDAVNPKMVQEFEKNPNKITVSDRGLNDYELALVSVSFNSIKQYSSPSSAAQNARERGVDPRMLGDHEDKQYIVKCHINVDSKIKDAVLNIGYLGKATRRANLRVDNQTEDVEFDRISAIKLCGYINSNSAGGGNVKPTELPLK